MVILSRFEYVYFHAPPPHPVSSVPFFCRDPPENFPRMGAKNSTFGDDVLTTSPDKDDIPIKRNPALNNLYKEIVRECYDHSHGETAARICMRMSQQRDDFRSFIEGIAPGLKQEFTDTMGTYLNNVVFNIDDAEVINALSSEYGEYHVALKNFGFKPDFFAVAADAIATECVFLGGQATAHAPANTFRAWTILVGLMFSGVRDGYYAALRKMRRQSPLNLIENLAKASLQQNPTPPTPRRRMLPSTNSSGSFDSTTTGSPRTRPVPYLNDSPSASNSTSRISSPCDSPQLPRSTVAVQRQTTFYIRETRPYIGSHSAFGAAQSCDGIDLIATRDRIRRHNKINYTNSNDDFIYHKRVSSAGSATGVPSSTPGTASPVVGRFQKNPPAVGYDQEVRRRQRIEDISRRHEAARLATHGKKSVSASNLFDPNKIMSDFMNDRYYGH
ncbi:hypothetical protein QR680_012381 [Steinernema hermaphroditum]|uniref:Globin family profile domain-containing protein n=1 Tax=Steinernema hermaphroditum TaxID=289476 RepID=A0AA39I1U8_9BILA|nr:hypothetical protein QR680_012381 [Steinernema hermaphroditum]